MGPGAAGGPLIFLECTMMKSSNQAGLMFGRSLLPVVVCLLLGACGRFGAPVPPEVVAPRAVEALAATAASDSVTITWNSPKLDRRSRELVSLDGYQVGRKVIADAKDVTNDEIPFETIGELTDRSVLERDRLRREAREQGLVGRKAKVPVELTTFTFTDREITSGTTYLYRITPINQEDVEGEVRQMVRVLFRGAESDVSIFDSRSIESEEIFVDSEEQP